MERVLLIDDSARDRRLARDALESEGYIVDEADGGAEGIRLDIRTTASSRRPRHHDASNGRLGRLPAHP